MQPQEMSHVPPLTFDPVDIASIDPLRLFLHFPLWPARGQWRPALETGFPIMLDCKPSSERHLALVGAGSDWQPENESDFMDLSSPFPLQLGIMWAWWEGLPSSSSSSSSSRLLRIPGTRTGEWGQEQKHIPAGRCRKSLTVPKVSEVWLSLLRTSSEVL